MGARFRNERLRQLCNQQFRLLAKEVPGSLACSSLPSLEGYIEPLMHGAWLDGFDHLAKKLVSAVIQVATAGMAEAVRIDYRSSMTSRPHPGRFGRSVLMHGQRAMIVASRAIPQIPPFAAENSLANCNEAY